MKIDLSGPWLLREALDERWNWYVDAPLAGAKNNVDAAAAVAASTPGWLAAQVPSSVRGDLIRAGEIASPYRDADSKTSEWVGERHWIYRRTIALPRPLGADEVAVLELDAVDPRALVFLDGRQVGVATGPFGTSRIDVGAQLADGGEHRLALVLDPAPASQAQVGRTGLVQVHAPRMTYGWDFCPRLPHQGIWGPVRIVAGRAVDDGSWASAHLDETTGSGTVSVRARVRAVPGRTVSLSVRVGDGATEVRTEPTRVTAGADGIAAADLTAAVADAQRWWPAGYGAQHRYDVALEADGEQVWERRVGFRSAHWSVNPGSPVVAEPYSLEVNGRQVRLTGWNWAPADALYGEITRERLRHLMLLARDSGARMLRIWGGGLIETPDFYDLADELGLLIWQEFSMSSSGMHSAPSEDPAFVQLMREAARSAVEERGHHPSLVLWGGGNELDLEGAPLWTEGNATLTAIADELGALDPERRWVATSPTGPVFHNRMDVIEARPGDLHDVHGPWEHQGLVDHYTLYNSGTCLSHTEFGVEGMASARQFDALITGDPRPLDRANPLMRHLGEWWNNAPLVHSSFGGRLVDDEGREDVDAVRRASQLMQATGLGYAVEADLRRAPRCSMVLPWQLAESFPNTWCTAVVEYHGDTKLAYQAVRRAFEDRRVTLRTDRAVWAGCAELAASAWLWADAAEPAPAGGTLRLALCAVDGTVLAEETFELGEVAHPAAAGTLTVPFDAVAARGPVLVWSAQWTGADGAVVDSETALLTLTEDWAPLCDLPAGAADVAVLDAGPNADGDDTWSIEVTSIGAAALVGLVLRDPRPADAPGYLRLRLDPAPLLPGHRRTLTATWDGVPAAERALVLEAWNLPGRALVAGSATSAAGSV